ncbi:hypothetical protein Nepgr_012213 [Nepenthes gracilis]|uniref:Uncharacterized protein n=1 Tax=Nepenthes gracilis TaxID=150966 RepID=A0AAD3SFQ7_NEPGR|nr:hypothetical protein Nepgr_012213 [Nepenthes gracilis]
MAGDDDQFSFPVVSNQIYQSVQSSPSLWRISSRVYHHDEEFADVRSGLDEASVAAAEEEEKEVDGGGREEDLDEKMDLLWEDFNREEKKEEEAKTMALCLLHALNASRGIGSGGGRAPGDQPWWLWRSY